MADGSEQPRLGFCQHGCVTRHLYRCPLRWADMDQLGHVNNATYVDYLQESRVDMLRVHPPAAGGEALAEGVVVVWHEVKYLAPLVFRLEPVSIEIWVTEVRAARWELRWERSRGAHAWQWEAPVARLGTRWRSARGPESGEPPHAGPALRSIHTR